MSRKTFSKYVLVMSAVLVAVPASLGAQEGGLKLAVVDVEAVVGQSTPGQELQARLQSFQQEISQELETLNQKAREIRQRATDGANSLSEERLNELNKQYEDATIAVRRFRDDKQREGQKMQEEGLREIERLLEPVFAQVREETGYDLILNRVPGVVLMASERVDITALMIERFNAATAAAAEE